MASIYSWESFIRLHGGEAGARDVFEKVIDDILRTENTDKEVHIIKASRGDGGIDVYVHQENGIDIYQCKFFMGTLDSSRWSQIKESFKKAMEPKGVKILRWYICMPREMQKEDIAKWTTYKEEKEIEFPGVKLCYIDGNEIISRMEECDRAKKTALIDKYFHEEKKKHFSNKDLIIPFTMSKTNGAQGGTYVPRDDLLAKIEDSFRTERIVFLFGMGGCGKSELARSYGYKHRDYYEEIFWLTCDDGSTPDFMHLMEKADLLCKIEKADMKNFSNKVLIIVDNCNSETPSFLEDLISWTGEAMILVTTRLSYMGDYESKIAVESDDPENFAYCVFEKNYCKKPRWGKAKELKKEDVYSVRDICRTVQNNTMIVSLIGTRLREYSNLSVSECARKISDGVGAIKGKIKYAKDKENRSEEMRDILRFLFADILLYPFLPEQKAVLTVLSLMPATWYEMDYICALLGELCNEYVIVTLLEFGWIQGNGDRLTIHPLIAEVMKEQSIPITGSEFYKKVIENYLGMRDYNLYAGRLLIYKMIKRVENDSLSPELKIATMLLINHRGYKKVFEEQYKNVKTAFFVWVVHNAKRVFLYRDIEEEKTYSFLEVPCYDKIEESVELLAVYNSGGAYKLDLTIGFYEKKIQKIPNGLCYRDQSINYLILPDSLKSIDDGAFFGCTRLKGELNFKEGLVSIGYGAFSGCCSLKGELQLPDTLKDLKEGAFSGCEGLSGDLVLPKNLSRIESNTFFGCKGFKGRLCLPLKLKSIGKRAFFGCSGLKGQIELPESLMSIETGAFFGCDGFSGELKLPQNLKRIEDSAFFGCSKLSGTLKLPNALNSVGKRAFYDCKGFDGGLILSGDLINIGTEAFSGCSGFSGRLEFPDKLISIGDWAFSCCRGLRGEIFISESKMNIGENAFFGCSSLIVNRYPAGTEITNESTDDVTIDITVDERLDASKIFDDNDIDGKCNDLSKIDCFVKKNAYYIIDNNIYITHVNDGKNKEHESSEKVCTRINDWAFAGCSDLNGKLCLPDTLKDIGAWAFSGCRNLSGELEFPKNLSRIGSGAFFGCVNLNGELNLREIKEIGGSAFFCCKGLSGILRLPDGIRIIKSGTFYGCSGFSKTPIFPKNLKIIGDWAFMQCTSFSGELQFPNTIESIDERAFYGCKGLKGEIRLPKSLRRIGTEAFNGCDSIEKITFYNKRTKIEGTLIRVTPIVIGGYKNSTAEEYAKKEGLVFEELVGSDL